MKGLLNKIGATAPSNTEPGLEAVIAKQNPNDPIIKDTMEVIDNLVNFYKDPSIKIDNRNDNIQEALDSLGKIFTKRFGANFEFDTDASLLSVSEVGPMSDTGISQIKTFITSLREDFSEEELMEHEVFRNYVRADKYMRENPVVIDIEKAYFRQWPKNTYSYIHINLAAIVGVLILGRKPSTVIDCADPGIETAYKNGYLMTSKTLVALLLHEVGHTFSFYTYQHLTKSTRCVFEDTLKDQIRKTGDAKKALYVAYQSAYAKSSFKVKPTDGMAKILINVVRSEGERYGFTKTKASSSDGEFIADQFASRFGLGAECAAALAAMFRYNIKSARTARVATGGFLLMWVLWVYMSGVYPLAVVSLGGVAAFGMIATISFAAFPILLTSLATYIHTAGAEYTYDTDIRRLERIRLDIVRQIRLYGHTLPKKELEKLLKDADDTKVIIDELVNVYPTKFKIISGLQTYVGNAKKEDELDKYLEETMENDLHLAALRFK